MNTLFSYPQPPDIPDEPFFKQIFQLGNIIRQTSNTTAQQYHSNGFKSSMLAPQGSQSKYSVSCPRPYLPSRGQTLLSIKRSSQNQTECLKTDNQNSVDRLYWGPRRNNQGKWTNQGAIFEANGAVTIINWNQGQNSRSEVGDKPSLNQLGIGEKYLSCGAIYKGSINHLFQFEGDGCLTMDHENILRMEVEKQQTGRSHEIEAATGISNIKQVGSTEQVNLIQLIKMKLEGLFKDHRLIRGTTEWTELSQSINQTKNFKYIGQYDDKGQFNRKGVLISAEGTYYGLFLNGLKHGKGRFEFSNGIVYQGEYCNGRREGQGTIYNAHDDKEQISDSQRDRLIAFQGQFVNGLPHGVGYFWSLHDKKLRKGEFSKGVRKRLLD